MGCGQYLCNRKRRKALFFGPCLKTEGAFFRALPEKIPRGICTGASFLLTLQSLPFFGSGLGTLTSCDETNRIARNAGKPLFWGFPLSIRPGTAPAPSIPVSGGGALRRQPDRKKWKNI